MAFGEQGTVVGKQQPILGPGDATQPNSPLNSPALVVGIQPGFHLDSNP